MQAPDPVARIAAALTTDAIPGNRHWRVGCPICQHFPNADRPPQLVLWQGRSQGWRAACMSGNEGCSPNALRLAIHRLLNAGKTEPILIHTADSVAEATARAQHIFRDAEPFRRGSAVELFLRRYGMDIELDGLQYVRQGPGKRPGEFTLIEGLLDPISVFDPLVSEPPILGVTMTFLRRDGEPVIIADNDTPKMKHVGRRQGLACPLGPVDRWDGGTIAVSVRVGHTLRHMATTGAAYGLAVAKAETLPWAYLPLGGRFHYEVSIADNGLALALAETLKESMEAAGSSVYIDANNIGKQHRLIPA